MSDFVLQPEDEFLAAHPGTAKIMVQVWRLSTLLLCERWAYASLVTPGCQNANCMALHRSCVICILLAAAYQNMVQCVTQS